VNAVNPGMIVTAMTTVDEDVAGTTTEKTPLKRDGKPRDVAKAVAFLASDEAGYISGQNLVVDGGLTIRDA